ncbi:MAG: hypothetical protein U0263_23305 [Polyangiaceae bacterium]
MRRWIGFSMAILASGPCALACGETSSDDSNGGSSSGGSSSGGSSSGGSSSGGNGGAGGAAASGGSSSDGSAGAAGGTDAGSCLEGGTLDAGVEATLQSSCVVAVIQVNRIDGECSGAGGEHITFDVIAVGKGPAVTRVQYGGHAYYPPPEGPDKVGDVFVAGIDPYGKLVDQPDQPGWCIVGLPQVDGGVHTLLEQPDIASAKAKMQALLTK